MIVELVASSATFQSDLGKAAAVAEQQARRIDKAIANTKKQALDFGKSIIAAFGVTASAAGLVALFDEIKQKTEDSERSIAQLNATLLATGGAAGLTASALEKLGKGVVSSTIFSAEDVRAAETALLRFRTVQRDVFGDAIKLVPDIASALGTDLPTAAKALGKALTDPETGIKLLKAAGLSLSEQQKDLAARMIEVGDRAGAQKIIIDELAASVGGASEADSKGLYGSTKRLSRAFADLEIATGHKLFGDNHTLIDSFTDKLDKLAKKASEADFSLGAIAKTVLSIFAGSATTGKIALDIFDTSKAQRTSKGKIGGLPDPEEEKAAAAAAFQDAKQAAEARYLIQQAGIKKLAESGTAFYAIDIARQKSYLDAKNSDLQFAYSRGLVTVDSFFDEQKRLAQQQITDDQATQAKVIANQVALIHSTGRTPADVESARARIQAAAAASNKAAADGELKIKQAEEGRVVALEQLGLAYQSLDADVLTLQGDTAAGAKLLLQVQDAADRRRFQKDPRATAQLDEKERLLGLTADLTAAQTKFGQVLQVTSIADSIVDLKLQTGRITEIDALNEKTALHEAYIPILEKEAAAYETLAKQSTNPAFALAAAELRLQIAQLSAQSDVLAGKFRDVFKGGLSDALTSFATGAKSAKDILRDLVKSIDEGVSRIAANNISEAVLGKGGPLGGLSDFFAGLFGGKGAGADATGAVALAGSAATLTASGGVLAAAGASLIAAAAALGGSAAGGSFASAFGGGSADAGNVLSMLGDVPFFAGGTDYAPGGMAIVGERGKELVNLPRGAQVIPNSVLSAKRSAKTTIHMGGITVNVPAGTSRASADQIAAETGRAVQRAMARIG